MSEKKRCWWDWIHSNLLQRELLRSCFMHVRFIASVPWSYLIKPLLLSQAESVGNGLVTRRMTGQVLLDFLHESSTITMRRI
ncbi:hypothetical protein P8452_66095 [Trifolium repens]|nr:hypothetical protein P8452_66095 [Trifolium repens]